MLLSKNAVVKWNGKNKQYYIDRGYVFTHIKDEFIVDITDLSPSSKALVEVQCDYCREIVTKSYQAYHAQHHAKYGDCCCKCQPQKNKLICLEKYGVDNGSKTSQAVEKIKQTSMERYGVINPSQSIQARQKLSEINKANAADRFTKIRATNIEKYGVECVLQNKDIQEKCKSTLYNHYGVIHPKQSEEIKEKERQHNQEKYGYDYYSQTIEAKEQIKQTNLLKYGYEHTLQVPEIRQKGMATLLVNGDCPTSKQQIALSELLTDIYGNCILNKPCGNNFLDCVISVDDIVIDIEYDGKYWHQDEQRDRRRDEFVKTQNYKILRIRANHSIPTKEQIITAIDYLVKDNHSFASIELDI